MADKDAGYAITWVGLLQIKDRRILMTREKGKDLFQLPGGGSENHETHLETLAREIREELNVEIKDPQIFDDFILPGRHEDVLIRFLIYTADILGDISPGEDIDEIRWIDSSYPKNSIDIGNPTKLKLIPRLVRDQIID